MGVVDMVCIIFPESDVIVLPLELLCRSLVHAVNIGERPFLRFPNVTFFRPTRFSSDLVEVLLQVRYFTAWSSYC